MPSEAPLVAGAAGVQNLTSVSSAPLSDGSPYGVLRDLQRWSSLDRQRAVCLRHAATGAVSIGRREGRAIVSGAAVCGCRSCPVCGPKIAAGRREELAGAIAGARALGWELRFATFTLRHTLRDQLADTLDALIKCFSSITSGRKYADLRARYGIRGLVRVIECKHGAEHGWHPHVHVLWFFDPAAASESPDAGLFDQLREQWFRSTRAAGYSAAMQGQDWRDVTDREVDTLAGYFAKEGADPIAWELTALDTKTRGESLTPAQLLALGATGDEVCRRLFTEYEQATAGRRLFLWTPGLLQQLLRAEPRPDEELAAGEPVALAECLVTISRDVFDALVDPVGTLAAVVQLVDAGADAESVAWWLADRGIGSAIAAPAAPILLEHVVAPPGAPDWLALAPEPPENCS